MKIQPTLRDQIKADIAGYERLLEFYGGYLGVASSDYINSRIEMCLLKIRSLKDELSALSELAPGKCEPLGDIIEFD